MSKRIFCLWLAFFCCSCVVSREKYAASLREAELAQGRLTDQKRSAQREREQLNAQLTTLQQEKTEAETKAKDIEQAMNNMGPEVALLGARVETLEAILILWRALLQGQVSAESSSFVSSFALPLIDPATKKPSFISAKTGLSLSVEGSALLKEIAARLPNNAQEILILSFAADATDPLKSASEYALAVAKALLGAGIAKERLRVSFGGAPCPDPAKCPGPRVEILLLAEGL